MSTVPTWLPHLHWSCLIHEMMTMLKYTHQSCIPRFQKGRSRLLHSLPAAACPPPPAEHNTVLSLTLSYNPVISLSLYTSKLSPLHNIHQSYLPYIIHNSVVLSLSLNTSKLSPLQNIQLSSLPYTIHKAGISLGSDQGMLSCT